MGLETRYAVVAVSTVKSKLRRKLITPDEVEPALKAIARDRRYPASFRKRIYRDLARFKGPAKKRESETVQRLRSVLCWIESKPGKQRAPIQKVHAGGKANEYLLYEDARIEAWSWIMEHMTANDEVRKHNLALAGERDRMYEQYRQKPRGGRPRAQAVDGNKIKVARIAQGFDAQKQFAKRCGISDDSLRRAENRNVATKDTLEKICRVLGIKPQSVSLPVTAIN
jgi:DNA-binding Xre family transcriptional regulator